MTDNNERKEFFTVTRTCREDIRHIYDNELDELVDRLSDSDMESIASKLEDDYCNQLYWTSLKIISRDYLDKYKCEVCGEYPCTCQRMNRENVGEL